MFTVSTNRRSTHYISNVVTVVVSMIVVYMFIFTGSSSRRSTHYISNVVTLVVARIVVYIYW